MMHVDSISEYNFDYFHYFLLSNVFLLFNFIVKNLNPAVLGIIEGVLSTLAFVVFFAILPTVSFIYYTTL